MDVQLLYTIITLNIREFKLCLYIPHLSPHPRGMFFCTIPGLPALAHPAPALCQQDCFPLPTYRGSYTATLTAASPLLLLCCMQPLGQTSLPPSHSCPTLPLWDPRAGLG